MFLYNKKQTALQWLANKMMIEIEDENTWPDEVKKIFKNNMQIIKQGKTSTSSFYRLEDEVNSLISGLEVVSYHCTRLLDYEIDEINKSGLQLPSKALLENRLIKAYEKGIIPQNLFNSVMERNEYLNMPCRENLLYFVCGVSALQNEGVSKFFQCWGGEAVFNSHELSKYRDILFCMGKPIIIRAKVIPSPLANIGKRIALAYLIARNIPTDDLPAFDHRETQALPANNILKIINFQDLEFLKLTNYQSWCKTKQPIVASEFIREQKNSCDNLAELI